MVEARLLRRYKRFLADVELDDGSRLTVHCPNPGAMTSCCEPGARVMMSPARSSTRKLPFSLELILIDGTWIGINPQRANSIAQSLLSNKRIAALARYSIEKTEVTVGESRLDFFLGVDRPGEAPDCFVEVKQATYRHGVGALFPDARSVRARRHVSELIGCRSEGHRAVMLFIVSRDDCEFLSPADQVDPEYGRALREAISTGVEVFSYRLSFDPEGVSAVEPIPVRV